MTVRSSSQCLWIWNETRFEFYSAWLGGCYQQRLDLIPDDYFLSCKSNNSQLSSGLITLSSSIMSFSSISTAFDVSYECIGGWPSPVTESITVNIKSKLVAS